METEEISIVMTLSRRAAILAYCTVASFLLAVEIRAFRPLQRLWRRPLFSMERTLPPLASINNQPVSTARSMLSNATIGMGAPTLWNVPSSFSDHKEENLKVLYTNDPKEINRWLTENLSMDGCTIGFDTEVGSFVVWLAILMLCGGRKGKDGQ